MRGKRVAQRVWADPESRAAARNVPRHQPLNAPAGQSSAPGVHKKWGRLMVRRPSPVLFASGEHGPVGVPLPDTLLSRLVERDDAFLASFAHDADHPTREVDVLQVQCDKLAQADAGGVKQLEDGAIAAAERSRKIRRLEQLRHLVDAEVGRYLLLPLWRDREHRRIGIDKPLAAQVTREGPQRGYLPRDGRARLSLTIELAKIPADHVKTEMLWLQRTPSGGVRRRDDAATPQ